MAEDVVVMQGNTPDACCAALTKKHAKLLERYTKLEEIKNRFRNCTELVQKKYDMVEKENEVLKKALEELKLQVNISKDEKEKECNRCVDLEDEVSALTEEVQLLKQNPISAPQDSDKEIQECFNVAEKEIKHLKELYEKEREGAVFEKNKAQLEKKKADEALEKVEAGNKKVIEAQKAAKQIHERLNVAEKEINHLKELLEKERESAALEKKNAELEKKKVDEALKKLDAAKKKVSEAQKAANVKKKDAESSMLLWEKLKKETDALRSMLTSERSKTEAADKKTEAEKQKTAVERKRAEVADAKCKEQRELAETNLKKAMLEKDRADDLNRKLEEARIRAEKLEESVKVLRSEVIVKAQADRSEHGKSAEKSIDTCVGMLKNDAQLPKWMEKILCEKDHNIVREKKRADSEKKKAKKQKKVAEAHKKMAMVQKHRADQLYNELESYKLRLKELQKELLESVSRRINADITPLRNNEIISESDSVKLLKKRLKLEKMLVKHANETAKVEALRTNMLHQELFHLKQECVWFQQRLDLLEKSFLHGLEGTHHFEKIGDQTSPRETLRSDVYQRPLVSGIDNQTMLQSSAINSCSTSFSDRTLVGSQERRMVSVTTSDKLGDGISYLKPTISRLSGNKRMAYNDPAVANSMGSPIKDTDNEKIVGYFGKKRILDAMQSIENTHFQSEKLHRRVSEKLSILHGILNDRTYEHEDIPKENYTTKLVKPSKRRKTSRLGMINVHHLEDAGEPKSVLDFNIVHSDACMRASPPAIDVMESGSHRKDDKIRSNLCLPQDFDEMATHDYMKLLELDDATDESSYRRAISMPLSPILPEFEFHGDEELEVDNPEMLIYKDYRVGSSNTRDNPASSSNLHIFDMAKDLTDPVIKGLVSSNLLPSQDSGDFIKSTGTVLGSDTIVTNIHVTDGKLGISDLSGSGNNESNILCESGIASTNFCPPEYFVLPSDHEDNSSILRILQTMHCCLSQCSSLDSTEIFLGNVLQAILKAEDLPMKEKICVFFSLLLHRVYEGIKNLTLTLSDSLVQFFDSVTQHIHSVLSDPILRRTFMESCDIFELFAVIENFILQRKVFVCGEISGELESTHTLKVNLVLNGNAIVVSEVVASSPLLVAGGCLLASLCSAVGQIGVVCEMSCNIIAMPKFEHPVMLSILHAFAHVCGSKYFTLQRYSIAMTVVKSLVVFLEKRTSSNKSTYSCPSSMVESQSEVWLCRNMCPFSEGALSIEEVALLLLENLRKHGRSECWQQDMLVPRVGFEEERIEKVSDSREAVLLSFNSDENLCDFTDILSLVEILAYFMSWDWTFDHIIHQICEFVESHLMDSSSAAILVLLGQLGRLGVDASGYDDARVKKLRGRLSAFVCESGFKKLSLSVQFAVVASLFGLTLISFEEIAEGKVEIPAATSQAVPATFIREWFFGLSYEQQSLFRLYQAGDKS